MAENYETVRRNVLNKEAKFHFYNTLTGLVKALEGQYTTIDLRNESCVTGKIIFVDAKMNVEMQDVVFYDSRGSEHVFPIFFVSKRNIRYVHIPKRTSAVELIETQLGRMETKRKPKEHTFKKVRAKRYNAEIAQAAFGEPST